MPGRGNRRKRSRSSKSFARSLQTRHNRNSQRCKRMNNSVATAEILHEDAKQGAFAMVQAKTFVPNGKPVIEVVGDNELVIVPDPEIKVHAPVPIAAVLAFIVAPAVVQTV